jgi:hypothetical protein
LEDGVRFRLGRSTDRGDPGPFARPVFVGGTGRSGTTIVARLLGAHPDFHMIPIEVRFIVEAGGLCDVVASGAGVREFRRRMLGRWFYREAADGTTRGLHKLMDRERIEDAVRVFERRLGSDPWLAGGEFVHRLLDPLAAAAGARGWIEMTPPNARVAPTLLRLFPDMRLIHSVRDGRDVACSIAPLIWGPNDVDEALDWWAEQLEQAFAACESLPPDRVLTVQMEDLVLHERAQEYARLLAFLGLDDDPAMRAFFASGVSAERAHIGRWAEQVPADRRPAFEAHHRRLVDDLRKRGRPVPLEEATGA